MANAIPQKPYFYESSTIMRPVGGVGAAIGIAIAIFHKKRRWYALGAATVGAYMAAKSYPASAAYNAAVELQEAEEQQEQSRLKILSGIVDQGFGTCYKQNPLHKDFMETSGRVKAVLNGEGQKLDLWAFVKKHGAPALHLLTDPDPYYSEVKAWVKTEPEKFLRHRIKQCGFYPSPIDTFLKKYVAECKEATRIYNVRKKEPEQTIRTYEKRIDGLEALKELNQQEASLESPRKSSSEIAALRNRIKASGIVENESTNPGVEIVQAKLKIAEQKVILAKIDEKRKSKKIMALSVFAADTKSML